METAKYKITGLVDIFDEQHNITGQYPIGSVQELSVEQGTKAVADGVAEAVGADELDNTRGASDPESSQPAPEGETGETVDETEDEDSDDEPTGETGESEVE